MPFDVDRICPLPDIDEELERPDEVWKLPEQMSICGPWEPAVTVGEPGRGCQTLLERLNVGPRTRRAGASWERAPAPQRRQPLHTSAVRIPLLYRPHRTYTIDAGYCCRCLYVRDVI